jgi:hypothetical protein
MADAKALAFEQWMRTFPGASDDQTLASLCDNDIVWAIANQMCVGHFVLYRVLTYRCVS